MTLRQWKDRGVISPAQFIFFDRLNRRELLSVFFELNLLLYAGVAAFAGGLAWTVQKYSAQLGVAVITAVLSILLLSCLWYCFSRAPAWSRSESPSPNLVFDYVLYLASLTWSVELSYVETRLHILSGQWDFWLLLTACLFFGLAYRFDNRLVLSLALAALAGWLGIRIQHWPGVNEPTYRQLAMLYSLVVSAAGISSQRFSLKAHFLLTYLNLATNVFFVAVLSGVFQPADYIGWTLLLLVGASVSLVFGLSRRHFSFVVYALIYGYIGVSSVLTRFSNDATVLAMYFVSTGIAMLFLLGGIARRFGRAA